MRTLTTVLLLVFTGLASAQSPLNRLEDFNSSPAWDGSSAEVSDDPNLVAQFQGKEFVCRNVTNFTPKESDAASRAFSDLVEYVSVGDKDEDFWRDATHKKKREDLLTAALKAGSWKADYLDSVWTIRYPSGAESAQKASARLAQLVTQGVPIAVFKYSTYLFGRDGAGMYRLLGEAIERGSPHAMTRVGTTIVVQSKALRPIGKAMLECAVNQGHANAYKGLGLLADMEGRRLDAYRLWERGLNEGCEECSQYMRHIAMARDYTPNKSMEDLVPELAPIKQFYESNFFYSLSELADFDRPLPSEQAFHPSDSELLLLLNLERSLRAVSNGPAR